MRILESSLPELICLHLENQGSEDIPVKVIPKIVVLL